MAKVNGNTLDTICQLEDGRTPTPTAVDELENASIDLTNPGRGM